MSTKKEFRQFQESAEKLLRETGKTEAEIAAWRERAYGPEAVGERVPVEPIDLDAV